MSTQKKSRRWIVEHAASMTREEAAALLDHERFHDRRWLVIERLHQRLTRLRAAEEREQLQRELAGAPDVTVRYQ